MSFDLAGKPERCGMSGGFCPQNCFFMSLDLARQPKSCGMLGGLRPPENKAYQNQLGLIAAKAGLTTTTEQGLITTSFQATAVAPTGSAF